MMNRIHFLFPVLLIVILIFPFSPGCGEGSSSSSPPSVDDLADEAFPEGEEGEGDKYSIQEVSDEVERTLGEEGGLDAVLLAFDSGYSLSQIVDGIMSGKLTVSGEIIDTDGSTLEPDYLPPDLIIRSGALVSRGKVSIWQMREAARRVKIAVGSRALTIIFSLAENGYSSKQIMEALLDGRVTVISAIGLFSPNPLGLPGGSAGKSGFIIVNPDGSIITPAGPAPQGTLQQGNINAQPPSSFPFTFVGERKMEIDATAEFGYGGTNSCSGKGSIWISILEKGLVVGEIEYIHFDLSWDEDGNATRCEASNRETTSFTGTHANGSFSFSTEWNASYTGVYTAQSIDGGAGKTAILKLGSGHTADYFLKSSFIIDRAY